MRVLRVAVYTTENNAVGFFIISKTMNCWAAVKIIPGSPVLQLFSRHTYCLGRFDRLSNKAIIPGHYSALFL